MSKQWIWLILAAVIAVPGLLLRYFTPEQFQKDQPILVAFAFGFCIVGAAFLLTWACEAIQRDVPQAFALSVLALIAIAPEYAVDWTLTYAAGSDPTYQEYAIANMIGANRMIVGFAWPLIIFIFALKFGNKTVLIGKSHRIEIGFLLLAGLYSISLPIKGFISIFDVVFLVGLFILYTVRLLKGEVHEPHLIGPAELIGNLPKRQRIASVLVLMTLALGAILSVAKAFASALIQTGQTIGVDEVFLIKWFAPLASESPEIVICVIFTLRGLATEGLGTLISSKVNQWTLLVGTLPLVYSLGAGKATSLPLSGSFEQNGKMVSFDLVGPMLVTSGQTLLAAMLILNLRFGLKGAGILFGLLIAQFFFPQNVGTINTEYLFAGIYFALAIFIAIKDRHHFIPTFKSMLSSSYVREQTLHEEQEAGHQELNSKLAS